MSLRILLMHDENHVHCAVCEDHPIIYSFEDLIDQKAGNWTQYDIFKGMTEQINKHFMEKHSLYDE